MTLISTTERKRSHIYSRKRVTLISITEIKWPLSLQQEKNDLNLCNMERWPQYRQQEETDPYLHQGSDTVTRRRGHPLEHTANSVDIVVSQLHTSDDRRWCWQSSQPRHRTDNFATDQGSRRKVGSGKPSRSRSNRTWCIEVWSPLSDIIVVRWVVRYKWTNAMLTSVCLMD